MGTKIEWAEESLNVVTGCTEKSPGCANCYARKMSKRLIAMGQEKYAGVVNANGRWTGKVRFHPEALDVPTRWRKPRRVFLNSMSDTFHGELTPGQVYRMLGMVIKNPRHTFIVVTKRAEIAKMAINWFCNTWLDGNPIPNLWLLVSVEDQKRCDERVPHLLGTNVVVRGLSMEPLLGAVDLALAGTVSKYISAKYRLVYEMLDWVIVGGESGTGARPMHPGWVRDIRDQCVSFGVPFFFKQWGAYAAIDDVKVFWNSKKKNGRVLDGRTWDEYPEVDDASL